MRRVLEFPERHGGGTQALRWRGASATPVHLIKSLLWSLFSILLRARPPVRRRKVPRVAATHLGGSGSPLLLVVHHQIAVGVGPVATLPLRLLAGRRIGR